MSENESSRCCRPVSSGATDGSSSPRTQSARSLICMAQTSAMFLPPIFADRASLLSRVPLHSGQVVNVTDPLHEAPDVRLQRLDVLGEHRLLDLRDHALVGEVDALDLDLGRLLVEEVVHLLLRVLPDRLVQVEADAHEEAAVPALHAVAGHHQAALVQRLRLVVQGREVEVVERAHAFTLRAHAALVDGLADDVLLDPAALLGAHDAARLARGHVERERGRAGRCRASRGG